MIVFSAKKGLSLGVLIALVVGAVYISAFFYVAFFDNGIFSNYGYPIHNGGDSSEYARLAQNLIDKGSFSLVSDSSPEMFRTPGYPAFLAPLYALDHSFVVAVLIQIILIIGCALLIYELGKKIVPASWAMGVALLFAFDPVTMFYALGVWSDTLFIFLCLLAVYFLYAYKKQSWVIAALSGIILGFSALVRPAGEYLVLIIAVFVFFSSLKEWKRGLLNALLIILAAVTVLAPWYVRNFEAGGAFGLSTTGEYTALWYDVKGFDVAHGMAPEAFDRMVFDRLHVTSADETRNLAYVAGMRELIKEEISKNSVQYGIYHMLGSVNLFVSSSFRDAAINLPKFSAFLERLHLSSGDTLNVKTLFTQNPLKGIIYSIRGEPLYTLERALRALSILLAVLGFVLACIQKRLSALYLLCIAITVYTALAIGPVSQARYRIAFEPFYLLAVAYGGALLLQWKSGGSSVKLPKS